MQIRGQQVEVDVEHELRQFAWQRDNWTDGSKLIACSPFRHDDGRPSFFVRLRAEDGHEAGLWADSGAVDDEWAKGHFVQLYAFLSGTDTETAEDLLLETYGTERSILAWRRPAWGLAEEKKPLPESALDGFSLPNPYLQGRGIAEDVLARFGCGFSEEKGCVAIPWRNASGRLATVKYRKTKDKYFWYHKEGIAIKHLLWGLHAIYGDNAKTALICESEIDALTSWTYGLPALAIGGNAFSAKRAQLLIKSPVENLYIATDNDAVGERIRREITKKVAGHMKIAHLRVPSPKKDLNEIRSLAEFQMLAAAAKKEKNIFRLNV